MQHFLNPVTILAILTVPLISGRWEALLIVLGIEICSQATHEKQHHPEGSFASTAIQALGIIVAAAGAYLLR